MSIGRVPGATGIQPSIVDAKGDLIVATAADSVDRLAVGTNEQRLVADSAVATGLKYVADTTNYAIAAKGDLLVGTAADTVSALTVGSANQVLTVDSSTATGLKWATPAAGALVKIKSATISSAADTGTTFDDVFTSTYRAYKIECRNITASTGNVLRFQWRKSGPSTHTANYYGMRQQIDSNPIITTTAITAGSYVDTITMSSDPNAASISVANIGNGSQMPSMYGHGFSNNFLASYWFGNGLNTAITGMGFILSASTGNFSGLVTVYGVEN